MRILGLDVGEKKIGVAVSDALGITAQGLRTLARDDKKGEINAILEIIKEMKVSKIVVGLPLNMNGTKGPKAEDASLFAEVLRRQSNIPVELWDERLTTAEAKRLLLIADVSRMKRKRLDDKMAAQLILQSYLDSLDKRI
ncbi:MAG: Holliday junction resolvase RuvX [Candidatus Omnitrophica bacterium]|nr:Holliday junction resolvase RuvX [Candidatus Omnitrophota bacterium]